MYTQDKKVLDAILNIVRHHLVTPDRLRDLVTSGALEVFFNPRAKISLPDLQRVMGVEPIEFEFTINYAYTVEMLVRAARLMGSYTDSQVGEYYVHIPEHGKTGMETLRADLYTFPRDTSLQTTSYILAGAGKRHATAYELLAFAHQFPHVQEERECVAAGTVLTGVMHEVDRIRGCRDSNTGYLTLGRRDTSVRVGEHHIRRTLSMTIPRQLAPHTISFRTFLCIHT